MTDIVERLLSPEFADVAAKYLMAEAADEIEHLRQDRYDYKLLYSDALRDYVEKRDEVERLRAALTRLVAWEGAVDVTCPELGGLLKAMYDARAALETQES